MSGRAQDARGTSLDRLKALDTLPDLNSQLDEAEELSSHPSRAHMIARWLLDKLRVSSLARKEVRCWHALESNLRLLPQDRIASLILATALIQTVESTLKEVQDDINVLSALVSLIDVLLQISSVPKGEPVKAALSNSASASALFLGCWLHFLSRAAASTDQGNRHKILLSSLAPVLRLWNLRKHSLEENSLFAESCIVPAALLIAEADSLGSSLSGSNEKKRFANKLRTDQDPKQLLEVLIARHIFLPARSAFFRAQDLTSNKGYRSIGSQNPAFTVAKLLQPLETARVDKEAGLLATSLPLLFDLAVRCMPLGTPQQRNAERPWVETLFSRFVACSSASLGHALHRQCVADLLSVVAKRATLSPDLLANLIAHHASDWHVLAKVLEVDAEVMLNEDIARRIFSSITSAEQEQIGSVDHGIHDMWRDRIVVPTMRAFGRRRDLRAFINLWIEELERRDSQRPWTVWSDVSIGLGAPDDPLTDYHVLGLLKDICDPIHSYSPAEDEGGERKLAARVVVLNALLDEMHREQDIDRSRTEIQDLLEKLCSLHRSSLAMHEQTYWSCITKLFELWLPWSLDGSATADMFSRNGRLLEEVCASAIQSAKSTSEALKFSSRQPSTAQDALSFVVSVCRRIAERAAKFESYTTSGLPALVNRLLESLQESDAHILLCWPGLLSLADADIRNGFVRRCLKTAHQTIAMAPDLVPSTLSALVLGCACTGHSGVVEGILSTCVDTLSNQEHAAVDIFLKLPASSLLRSQRERIIDAVAQVPFGTSSDETFDQRRLALLIKLMGVPNATCKLCTDQTEIWRLVAEVDENNERWLKTSTTGDNFHDQNKTLKLLEDLVILILGQLLATQDQARSRSMLTDLSKEAKVRLERLRDDQSSHVWRGELLVVKAIFVQCELSAKSNLKDVLPHYNQECFERLICFAFEHIRKTLLQLQRNDSARKDWRLVSSGNILLETLLAIPEASYQLFAVNTADLCKPIADVVVRISDGELVPQASAVDVSPSQYGRTTRLDLVSCFEVTCRFASDNMKASFIRIASILLQLKLEPERHARVIRTCELYMANLDSTAKLDVTQDLLDHSESHGSLLQICTQAMQKDELTALPTVTSASMCTSLLTAIRKPETVTTCRQTIICLIKVLKEKQFMVDQHIVEDVLYTAHSLVQQRATPAVIFLDVCNIISTLFLHHRSRLQGRFHILIRIFRAMISRLFDHSKARHAFASYRRLTSKHAYALARLLILFCEPAQVRRDMGTASSLVDETRKEQAHVGQYVQYLLHYYCTQVLSGTLIEDVREALVPGLWSMFTAMEMNDSDGIKSLSAAMNNSERAVLRGVYDDWRRFGKWRGG